MKTFEEFESALLKNEKVFVTDGDMVVEFYSAMRSNLCGVVTVCVEVSLPCKDDFLQTCAITARMSAYHTYKSLCGKFNKA